MYTRRGFLAATGVGAVASLAGCLGDGRPDGGAGGGSDGDAPADGSGEPASGGDDAARLVDHPAGQGLEDQPVLGPSVDDATAVIVAFEDPSCITCRRFEERTFPTLRSELIDPGDAAFVFRVMPIIYPWGKPASQALEATFARDADAFWALKAHYYAEQRSFDTDTVLEKTAAFLDANTGLDGEAVAVDARDRRYDDQVRADLSAGEAVGVVSTPTFALFRDGVFRTTVTGAKDASVFSAALGF